jgi:Zn-dependent peptidase ImmA (M78 family)/transcriptional regulator with XRE-family HTH domain
MTGHPGQRPRALSLAQPAADAPAPAETGRAIASAREGAGLTQDDVAAALGTSRQAVGYWEQGKRRLPHHQLLQLAALFRTTVDGLLSAAEGPVQSAVETAAMLWRKSNIDLDDTARDGIKGFTDFLDFYARLAHRMKRDATGLTRSPFLPGAGYGEFAVDARRKASEVRHYLGLGQGPIADITGVCEALGITIYRAHLGSDLSKTISGAFFKHPVIGFSILVNLDMTRGRRRFTLTHELAHALLHSATDAIVVSDTGHRGEQRETYADAFAGEFLMPEEGIRRTLEWLGAGPKVDDVEPVIRLQHTFNVSYITALVRLRQANIITMATLDKLRVIPPVKITAAMGITPDWPPLPGSVADRFPLRFRSLLREACALGEVDNSVIQENLGLTSGQAEELVEKAPVISYDDLGQEWDEHEALGAVPA